MAIPTIPVSLEFRDDEKPYVEVVRGRVEAKVSPRRAHALVQLALAEQLRRWAAGHGEVGTEWRFYLLRGENQPSSLVPDVAYVSFERLPRELPSDARERPRIAPDIAAEIWSPGDSRRTLEEKVELYLSHGSRAVIVVDPGARTVTLHRPGTSAMHAASGKLVVPAFCGLALDSDALFAEL
jgi:Uma2 family endonuclease